MGWFEANEALVQLTLINMMLAASLQVTLNAGMLSLAPVAAWGVGGFIAANLAIDTQLALGPILLIVAVAVAAGAFLVALPILRLRGLAFAMATLAVLLIVGSLSVTNREWTGGSLGLYGIPVLTTTGALVVGVVAVALVLARIERREMGRRVEVLRLDEAAARTLGVAVDRIRLALFVLAATIAGVSGALSALAFNNFSSQNFGFDRAVTTLAMVVIGGTRSWLGAFLGAFLLTFSPYWFDQFDVWNKVAYGAMMIAVVGWFPDGLLGLLRSGIGRLRAAIDRGPGTGTGATTAVAAGAEARS
ncbi:MAG TPA: branched-chain amino acid ABC transporter permease [Acidimicrobiales bacterium]